MFRIIAVVLAIMQFAFGSALAELAPHPISHDHSDALRAAFSSLNTLEELDNACGTVDCEEPDRHSHCPAIAGACGSGVYPTLTTVSSLSLENTVVHRFACIQSLGDGLMPEIELPPPRA
jgi:hypothetical protein